MKKSLPKTILFATKNAGKIRELREMLAPFGVELCGASDFPAWRDVDEVGETFAANAILKSENGAALTGLPTIADDSGLMVDALFGAPGVKSARFASAETGGMTNADDEANNRLLLEKLANKKDRSAKYACVIAFSIPHEMPQCFYGETSGQILVAPRGTNGFGYDPLFFSADLQCSFGEAAAADKHRISHRGRALQKFIAAFTADKN